jgi:hypothetical protein
MYNATEESKYYCTGLTVATIEKQVIRDMKILRSMMFFVTP